MTPRASDDLPTPVARARPWWTTRPGWCAPRARRTAPPGGDTPAHGARRTRSSLMLGGLVLAAVLSTQWVRVNVSPSVPVGLYRLAPLSVPLERGTLVVLPVPAAVWPWHARWLPFLKPVAAVAGDVVCVQERGLWIDGVLVGLVWREADGKPLPQVTPGCGVVPEGEVFLASQAPNSLDSRYFGAVPITTLTAQAFPLVTWRDAYAHR